MNRTLKPNSNPSTLVPRKMRGLAMSLVIIFALSSLTISLSPVSADSLTQSIGERPFFLIDPDIDDRDNALQVTENVSWQLNFTVVPGFAGCLAFWNTTVFSHTVVLTWASATVFAEAQEISDTLIGTFFASFNTVVDNDDDNDGWKSSKTLAGCRKMLCFSRSRGTDASFVVLVDYC